MPMMRPLLVLLLAAACGGRASVHDLGPCESGSGDCEHGCRRGPDQPTTDAGACATSDPASGPAMVCGETFYTDGRDPNHRGCCVRDPEDGVLRFRECCELVEADGGARYECPE